MSRRVNLFGERPGVQAHASPPSCARDTLRAILRRILPVAVGSEGITMSRYPVVSRIDPESFSAAAIVDFGLLRNYC